MLIQPGSNGLPGSDHGQAGWRGRLVYRYWLAVDHGYGDSRIKWNPPDDLNAQSSAD